MLNLYEITYILTNILGTYIVFKLLTAFFNNLRTDKKTELITYIAYYLVSSACFFLVRIPAVMMEVTLISFFCLSLNYHSTLKKRLIASFLSFMILLCIEVMVVVISGYFQKSFLVNSEYDSIIGLILIRAVSMLVVSIITNFKNIRRDVPVPNFYWFGTIFISVASLYQFLLLLGYSNLGKANTMISIIIILCINFIVLFLYDNLYKAFAIKSEKLLLEKQNIAYEQQLELMCQSLSATQVLRHDMKNHMIALKNLYLSDDDEGLREYMDNIISTIDNNKFYSRSGNYVIDSIVNFKLQEVADIGVVPEVSIIIPEKINISSYDITVILGNLLDNAIEALRDCKSERILSIKIKYSKSNIIILIINSFNKIIKNENGKFQTTKQDMQGHGLGLLSVEEVAKKNNVHINIHHGDNLFKVTVLLPVDDIAT